MDEKKMTFRSKEFIDVIRSKPPAIITYGSISIVLVIIAAIAFVSFYDLAETAEVHVVEVANHEVVIPVSSSSALRLSNKSSINLRACSKDVTGRILSIEEYSQSTFNLRVYIDSLASCPKQEVMVSIPEISLLNLF